VRRSFGRAVVLAGSANTQLASSNLKRKRIRFSLTDTGGNSVLVGISNTPLASYGDRNTVCFLGQVNTAVTNAPMNGPAIFDVELDGDMVTKEWHAYTPDALVTVAIIESMDDEE
jgi:hypothetical protein